MTTTMKVSMKLLIDAKANKVLFAEANKELVDFLFHILSLPVATVIKLLGVKDMVGSLGILYNSISSLSTDYMQAKFAKKSVLNPTTAASVPLLSLNDAPQTYSMEYYRCNSPANHSSPFHHHYGDEYDDEGPKKCRDYVTDNPDAECPRCGKKMCTEMSFVASKSPSKSVSWNSKIDGYVKGVVTYMVMDNLEIKPMSTIASITLLNNFNISDIASLVEKEVQLTLNEVIISFVWFVIFLY